MNHEPKSQIQGLNHSSSPSRPSRPSRWMKGLAKHHNIRCVWIDASSLVTKMIHIHHLSDLPGHALGEATVGALMLASYCKPGERINLQLQGSGICRQAFVDANPEGQVRGYVIPNSAEIKKTREELGIWGQGVLTVLRTQSEEGHRPYLGNVPLETGHLEKDLRTYWISSEQVTTRLLISVQVQGSQCLQAFGILIQTLGGASEEEIALVQDCQTQLEEMKRSLSDDPNPFQWMNRFFKNRLEFSAVEDRKLSFHCPCSFERVQRALVLAGQEELKSLLEKENGASVRCDFCTREYKLDSHELQKLITQAQSP